MTELDNADKKLIGLLRQNGRAAISDLAIDMGLSRVTVRKRLERLVKTGVIESFTVRLGGNAEKHMIRAVMLVCIDGAKSEAASRAINKITEVSGFYSTSGQWDAMIMLEAESLERFDRTLREMGAIPGFLRSETSIMLGSRRTVNNV
ncbi:Lrp/AsnC family transcriptional regulator [Candidatus Halocynthiibacter alkanivorans]|jgi:DNA-binding Lrp family transcriptional regulator|uniref:Lrp/AsnC family transcriptional regulator n=1 Tax=Candidatus Halocynthiibacter alkanivorans TaxID=2267619 RepID=UPI000DF148D2|nr:Lrp/AsnC family transcriptional regulator [Candidatus Halocynthiibacter alkanivorans]